MTNGNATNAALCAATYRAAQRGGTVTIHAQGEHGTPGYQVFFEQSPIRIFPPQFVLRHIEPTGIITTQVTPFDVQISFAAADPIAQVIVHDDQGRHEVPVEQVPVVATRTRSGGFIATQETLTVYADGTLQFVNERLDQNETQHVNEHQLRPLQRALARPQWQTIKAAYGEPIADGFTISISGGGKQTTIADPPATPVQIPAIVQEVLQHLEALWPIDGVAAEVLGEQEPNRFALVGGDVRVTYQVTTTETVLHYQDRQRNQTLRDAQIETTNSQIGTLLTIPLRFIPDPLALTQTERVTFTVLLPQIKVLGTSTDFETLAIRTEHRAGGGARQQYDVVVLQGTAHVAANGAPTPDDLPPALFKRWVHAREEDTGDLEVYRPQGTPLPPAFGRTGFEIKRNGDFIQHDIGPADEPLRVGGCWTVDGTRQLRVELDDGRVFALTIVSLDDQLLAVRRVDVRQANDVALAAE